MPIRVQTVVSGETPDHQPATLQVHGSIANIIASMEVIDLMQRRSSRRRRMI